MSLFYNTTNRAIFPRHCQHHLNAPTRHTAITTSIRTTKYTQKNKSCDKKIVVFDGQILLRLLVVVHSYSYARMQFITLSYNCCCFWSCCTNIMAVFLLILFPLFFFFFITFCVLFVKVIALLDLAGKTKR